MANLRNQVPASLRRPSEQSNFASGLAARSGRMTMLDGPVVVAPSGLLKGRFAPLPQESADAKITGLTRSLTRRLLGLNMPKRAPAAQPAAKTAA